MPDVGATRLLDLRIDGKTFGAPGGGRVAAVSGLSLALAPHEFVCLIGPSGCGKTTTLRILLGLDRDFAGHVLPDPGSLAVGVVFQEPRLLPWRTVEQNVRLALPAPRSRDLAPLLAGLGLSEWRDHFPGALSLGMARRVALARALAVEPDLLVLDEPFVSLDDRAAAALRGLVLAAFARRRMSVLMVTHNVREAIELADRLVFLTPRPARVEAEVRIEEPRSQRTPAWIEERRARLIERFPALMA